MHSVNRSQAGSSPRPEADPSPADRRTGREDDGDVKLHASTVAESITNWPEVVDKLRGTRFEKYLTMDGSVLP